MEVVHAAVSLSGETRADGGGAAVTLTGTVHANPRDPAAQPLLLGQVSGALCRALMARRLTYRWRFTWNGVEIPASDLVFPLSVRHQRHGLHSWSAGLRIRRDGTSLVGRLGSPPMGGVEAFCAEVSLSLLVHTDQGAREVVLLHRGVVKRVDEQRQPPQIRLSGLGRGGRYERATAGVLIPRGSLRPRGAIARQILTSAGVPEGEIALSGGAVISKLVNAEAEAVYPLVNELLLPELRALHHEPATGVITTAPLGRLPGSLIDKVGGTFSGERLSSARILSSGAPTHSAGTLADGPTRILTHSVRQLVDPDCGEETTRTTTRLFRPMHIPLAVASHDPAGQLVPVPFHFSGAPKEREFQRVEVLETKRCGKLVYRRTGKWEWFRGGEVWKAALNPDGSIAAVNTTGAWMYAEAGQTPGPTPVGGFDLDPTPTYRRRQAVFQEVEVTHEYWDYEDGVQARYRRAVEGWRGRRAWLKRKDALDPSIPWEELPYRNLARVLANGQAIQIGGEGERYLAFTGAGVTQQHGVSLDETAFASKGGYIEQEITTTSTWDLQPGTEYWFGEGLTSRDPEERFLLIRRESKTAQAKGDDARQEATFTELPTRPTDPEHLQVRVETVQGSLEAVPTSAEPEAGGVAAPADATQRIQWAYDLGVDPACRLPRTERVEVAFAESVGELRAVAEHLGAESLKRTVQAETLLQPTLSVLRPVALSDPPFLELVLHPTEVEHLQSAPDALPVTRIVGDVYDD